jgi:hypothetical protein
MLPSTNDRGRALRRGGGVKAYPAVLSELKTLELVCSGRSLARYGDGEFKMAAHGASIKSQRAHAELSERLLSILHRSGECLVGIPNIHEAIASNPDQDKVRFWTKQLRFAAILSDRSYVSSFVTRPDSASWLKTSEAYWQALASLWVGQDVTLVRGSTKSLVAEDLIGAREVREIVAPRQHAWGEYDSLLERIGRPAKALLCLGPTATVMAVDLCARGVHAIDLGHVGMFLRHRRNGDAIAVTEADKVPA